MRTRSGREFVVLQASNDWMRVDYADGGSGIQTPSGVRCTRKEWQELLAITEPPNGGTFHVEWRWEVSAAGTETLNALDVEDQARAVPHIEGIIHRRRATNWAPL